MATEVQPPPPRTARAPFQERAIGELFKKLRDETATLFRKEVQLAKAETAEKAKAYAHNSAVLVIGGVLGFAGLLVTLVGLGYAVSAGLMALGVDALIASWLGPIIVGLVVALVGYIMVRKGMNAMKRETPVPERTLRSLQENQAWVKHKLSQHAPET